MQGKCDIPAKEIYLLAGTATDKIIPELDKTNINYNGPFKSLNEMLTALKSKLNAAVPAPVNFPIVFSPGATSFGMFNNEFDRGEKFMAAVKEIFIQE